MTDVVVLCVLTPRSEIMNERGVQEFFARPEVTTSMTELAHKVWTCVRAARPFRTTRRGLCPLRIAGVVCYTSMLWPPSLDWHDVSMSGLRLLGYVRHVVNLVLEHT